MFLKHGLLQLQRAPYAYSNGTWKPVKATKILPHQPLAASRQGNQLDMDHSSGT